MGKDLKGKELGTGIRQLKNGKYEARFVDRFGDRKSIYATSKIDIRRKLKESLEEDVKETGIKKRITVTEWYHQWMKIYKEPVIRENSKLVYQSVFKLHILPEIGLLYLDEVKPIHIKEIINQLDAKGYKWDMQNKVKVLTNDLFNLAIENNYVVSNPTKSVRLKRNKPRDRYVLTKEQQEDFMNCAFGTFYGNLYIVALNTGLRPGELCALTEPDIDFESNEISVTKTLIYQRFETDNKKEFHIGEPKTISSIRKVPITEQCRNALKKQIILKKIISKRHPEPQEFPDLLFVTQFNTPICSQVLNDSVKKIINEVNLQKDELEKLPTFSAHTFRHTFATRCIESGISPKTVQCYLGHATLNMTMDLYVHTTNDFKFKELEKLETYYSSGDAINITQGKLGINGV